MEKRGYVCILASGRNGTVYIGLTSNLVQRVWQHKSKSIEGFTTRYDVDQLVYYEAYDDIADAIAREKTSKKWRRRWKLELIKTSNPDWRDLYDEIANSVS